VLRTTLVFGALSVALAGYVALQASVPGQNHAESRCMEDPLYQTSGGYGVKWKWWTPHWACVFAGPNGTPVEH
jgi:hypothetical protein